MGEVTEKMRPFPGGLSTGTKYAVGSHDTFDKAEAQSASAAGVGNIAGGVSGEA
jgi:hypothetical protein